MAEQAAQPLRPGWRRYAPVWSVRQVRFAFAATLVARMAQTMVPLTLLLVFRQRTGSFAAAGSAVALFSLAFVVGGPVTARFADRHGAWVLAGAGAVSAASLALLAATASPVVSWVAVAAAGVSVPPLTAALRAVIVVGLTTERDRATAFSLDAIATEVLFVVGPVFVSVATALDGAAKAFAAAGALVLAGSALMTRYGGRAAHRPVSVATAARHPALLAPWLAIGAAQLAATGFVEVAAAARVIQLGHPAAAGMVLAVWAAGSIVGGLIYGIRDWPGSAAVQLRVLLLLLAFGFAIVVAATSLAVLYPLMFVAGLACAPAASALTRGFSAHAGRAENFAWLASAASLGGSLGYAAAGLLLAHASVTVTILTGAALPVITAVIVPRTPRPGEPRASHRI